MRGIKFTLALVLIVSCLLNIAAVFGHPGHHHDHHHGHDGHDHHDHDHDHDQDHDHHDEHSKVLAPSGTTYVNLTPDNFDEIVYGKLPAFVAFTAPWCGVCQKMKPDFSRVAEAFQDESVIIANADVEAYPSLGERFSITSFPTLKYFPVASENVPYTNGRTAPDFASFLNTQIGTNVAIPLPPSFSLTLDPISYKELVASVTDQKSQSAALIMYYAPWCSFSQKISPTWEDLARSYRGDEDAIVFGRINGDMHYSVVQQEGIERYPALKLFSAAHPTGLLIKKRSLEDLITIVNAETNAERTPTGKFPLTYGLIPSLDKIAYELADVATNGGSVEAMNAIVDKMTAAITLMGEVDLNQQKMCAIYQKMANDLVERGWQFPYIEVDRLARITEKGHLTPAARNLFAKRTNIARSFQIYV